MKKLKLEIEELAIETFEASAVPAEGGTVLARSGGGAWCASYEYRIDSTCQQFTYDQFDSQCYDSGGSACTAVCPSGWAVCDTSPEVCG